MFVKFDTSERDIYKYAVLVLLRFEHASRQPYEALSKRHTGPWDSVNN